MGLSSVKHLQLQATENGMGVHRGCAPRATAGHGHAVSAARRLTAAARPVAAAVPSVAVTGGTDVVPEPCPSNQPCTRLAPAIPPSTPHATGAAASPSRGGTAEARVVRATVD